MARRYRSQSWSYVFEFDDPRDRQSAIDELLSSAPETLHGRDSSCGSLLHHAISFGDLALVVYLLRRGASPNGDPRDVPSPLIDAVGLEGENEVMCSLLSAGAEIDHQSQGGSALMHAVRGGRLDRAEILLSCGADVNLGCEDDATPLWYAGFDKNAAGYEFLLRYGADEGMVDHIHRKTPREMLERIA